MIKNVFRKFSGIFGFSKGFLIKPLMDHKGFYKETLTKTKNVRKFSKMFDFLCGLIFSNLSRRGEILRSLREEDWYDWEMEARSAPVISS